MRTTWFGKRALYQVALACLLAFGCSNNTEPTAGPAGANALTNIGPESAGANCPYGGTRVQVGLDKNGNGTLDADEVSGTSYVCNGQGSNSLVRTTVEPGGTNCQFGGVKIDSGLDKNNNGKLDDTEVDPNGTTYVCNLSPNGAPNATDGLVANIKAGGVSTTSPITVRFTLKDSKGFPVDLSGVYSTNLAIQPRFSLAYYTKDQNGAVQPYKVYTQTTSLQNDGGPSAPQPSNYNPLGTAPGQGKLVENGLGAGDYTYTFPATDTAPAQGVSGCLGVNYDQSKMGENHVVWIQVSRQTNLIYPTNANTYYTANYPYYFIPAGGQATAREIVKNENCQKCHDNFRLETTTTVGVHGGGRTNGNFCNTCHNPDRYSNPAADSKVYIHRIHQGEQLQPQNLFHGIAATFPQDTRKCDVCHGGAAQGDQALTVPTRAACGSCHDYVSFTGQAAIGCTDPVTTAPDQNGNPIPVPCNHMVGQQLDDTKCTMCHTQQTIADVHKPIVPPDPANSLLDGGTNANTNAGNLPAGGYAVAGAAKITWIVSSVGTWSDNGTKRPQIVFKFQNNGQDVTFNAPAANAELMANFVGGPSAYWAFAVPQDGINTPADFNATASVYLRAALQDINKVSYDWSGPDGSGFYTVKVKNQLIPSTATMLTGGIGYTYSLTSTMPLTETDVQGYPYNPNTKQGGLVLTVPNVWKVADPKQARRTIVDNEKCKNCHGVLGVEPTFHAGQRNDGPTCAFCHTTNKTSSGWSAGSRSFIHAIHGARKRTVPFMWHAASQTGGFGDVEFPAALNDCQMCHVPNGYDFTNPAALAALPNMNVQATATGTYDPKSSTKFTDSPYVVVDGVTNYGVGFSFDAKTGNTTVASTSNLVNSPITNVCTACHDSNTAVAHIRQNGGAFYDTRGNNLGQSKEQCMICHGPGRVAAIGEVHLKR